MQIIFHYRKERKPIVNNKLTTSRFNSASQSLFFLGARGIRVTWEIALWESGVEPNFPRGHGCDSRPASAFSVTDLMFPISLFIGCVSHADLTTVVLDAVARTAFPATRPEAHAVASNAVANDKAKKSKNIGRPLFLLFG